MTTNKACPAVADLERLMLGQMPDSDTDRLALHVEECERCVATLRSIQSRDTLLDAVRHAETAVADLPGGEGVQRLIGRLRGLAATSGARNREGIRTLMAPTMGRPRFLLIGSFMA